VSPSAPLPLPLAPPPAADDETARLRARLAELERHVEEIQAIASLGSYEWFVAEDRIFWSAEQLRIHGFDAATQPRTLAEFLACIHPDDRADAEAGLERLMREGRGTSRYRVVRPGGEVRTVLAHNRVVRDADGRPVRVVGTVQDVTHVASAEAELRAANERLEQRVAERTAALERSEGHFRRLIEHTHDLIVIVGGDGTAHYGSPSVRRVLGYAPEAVNGDSILPLVHPDDRERTAGWLRGLAGAAPGTRHCTEYRFLHADGHWVTLESVYVTDADDRADRGHVINIRDVTDRRRAEEALRAEEARYRSLVEQLPAIIYTAALADGYPTLFVSPHAERLLGYGEAAWLANPRLWLEAIHPDDRARVEAAWNAAHAGGRRFAAEYRMLARDGRVLWFRDEAAVLRDAAGRPQCIQGVMLDVTERREAERALEERDAYFRSLIENAHDIVTILDREGRMQYQSPSLTRVLGYTPEELAGRSAFAYMHPEDAPRVAEQLGRVLAEPGSTGHAEYRFRHKDGSWRHVEAFGRTVSPHTAADGVVANVRDVTERREAELALQRREEQFRRLIENGATCS
jgi:PAS domain S-box-containing protein